MKYCSKCGAELVDEAVVCTNCGCAVEGFEPANQAQENTKPSGLQTAAKVLMIITTVLYGLYIIPLAWCIPMTVSYCKKIKKGLPVGTGFKVCTLLFVNTIAGVLMFCDNTNNKQ